MQLGGEDREDLVAVDDVAALVDEDAAVGVAVERDADVRAGADRRLEMAGCSAPASRLMFSPFGSTPSG